VQIKVNAQDRTLTISGERRRPAREVVPEVNSGAVSTEGGEAAEGETRREGETEPVKDASRAEESKTEEPQRKRQYERRMGKFERTFTLSEKADVEAVSAR
jgi:HSP20 family molecular chaperone IbpA